MLELYEDIDTNELFTKSELENMIYDNGIETDIKDFIFQNLVQKCDNI